MNIGRGRILPTLAWESMWEGLSQWMGVHAAEVPRVLPNLGNFPKSKRLDLKDLFDVEPSELEPTLTSSATTKLTTTEASTAKQTTAKPTTQKPSTAKPSTEKPSTAKPSSATCRIMLWM